VKQTSQKGGKRAAGKTERIGEKTIRRKRTKKQGRRSKKGRGKQNHTDRTQEAAKEGLTIQAGPVGQESWSQGGGPKRRVMDAGGLPWGGGGGGHGIGGGMNQTTKKEDNITGQEKTIKGLQGGVVSINKKGKKSVAIKNKRRKKPNISRMKRNPTFRLQKKKKKNPIKMERSGGVSQDR